MPGRSILQLSFRKSQREGKNLHMVFINLEMAQARVPRQLVCSTFMGEKT